MTKLPTAPRFPAPPRGMSADTYRGWTIHYDPPPIPIRNFDWQAYGPNYDASYEGEEDGWVSNGEDAQAPTREALTKEIDAWFEDHCGPHAMTRRLGREHLNARRVLDLYAQFRPRTWRDDVREEIADIRANPGLALICTFAGLAVGFAASLCVAAIIILVMR